MLKNTPPTGSLLKRGPATMIEVEDDGAQRQRRNHQRADIVHDAAGAPADALEPMVIARPALTSSAASVMAFDRPVDVAAGDVVADFEDHEQHGEQDGAGIDDARRQVVGAPPQQPARDPE